MHGKTTQLGLTSAPALELVNSQVNIISNHLNALRSHWTSNTLASVICHAFGVQLTEAAAAAGGSEPAAAAFADRRAAAGPPGVTSGAAAFPVAPGSAAQGSPLLGTALHVTAAVPTCAYNVPK